jgi:hypothetical protein
MALAVVTLLLVTGPAFALADFKRKYYFLRKVVLK